jgi:N-acetylglucosamine kinase-like BadF-type ATPase
VEDGHQVAVADGLGWLLGDEGSGFWIGRRVVRAVLADLDGRGPSTALTPLLLARLGIPSRPDGGDREPIGEVVRTLYAIPPVRLADHAGLAFEVERDAVADGILDAAAAALARSLGAVRSPSVSGPLVLGGGILGRGPQVADRLTGVYDGKEIKVVADGVVGVCVLAVRHAGTVVDASVFDELTTSLAAVR